MRTIFADFNALTEAEHVRLTTRGSQEDIQKYGIRPGDWVWLSDGELQVGAKIAEDPRYRLVGIPAWETVVYLRDEEHREPGDLFSELRALFEKKRSRDDESRLLQVITWFVARTPDDILRVIEPGFFDFRRAGVLLELGLTELAFLAIQDALHAQPAKDAYIFSYLELLRRLDLDRALEEARRRVGDRNSSSAVLAACINILATHADRLTGPEQTSACIEILDWNRKFQEAPLRDRVLASTLSQVEMTVGLALLQLGRLAEARLSFQAAYAAEPQDPSTREALGLDAYNDRARSIASRTRDRLLPQAA